MVGGRGGYTRGNAGLLLCVQFLSAKKCDCRSTRQQKYLVMVCDSDTVTFRVPQDKLDKLQQLL